MMLQILFVIFLHDIWFYMSHVILHEPLCYELFHKKHHSDNYVSDWVQTLFQGCGFYLASIFVTYHTMFISFLFITIRRMMQDDPQYTWLVGNHRLLHYQYPNTNFGESWIDTFCKTKKFKTT